MWMLIIGVWTFNISSCACFLQRDEDSVGGGGGDPETDEVDNNITRSSLSLVPSTDDDGEKIRCVAENPWVPRSTVEDSWVLHVVCKATINLTTKRVSNLPIHLVSPYLLLLLPRSSHYYPTDTLSPQHIILLWSAPYMYIIVYREAHTHIHTLSRDTGNKWHDKEAQSGKVFAIVSPDVPYCIVQVKPEICWGGNVYIGGLKMR